MSSALDAWCRYCRRHTDHVLITVCDDCHAQMHREITEHLTRAAQKASH